MTNSLCPGQQLAFDRLCASLPHGPIFTVIADAGMGKTTVLRALHDQIGGTFLTCKDYLAALRKQHPLAIEESFEDLVMAALGASDCVIVDDLHLLTDVVGGCGNYPRAGLLNVPLTTLTTFAQEKHKKLILGADAHTLAPIRQRSLDFQIAEFAPADYGFLCRDFLGPRLADGIDFNKVHRFAPHLSAHFFKTVCPALRPLAALTTEEFIEYLRAHGLSSNVDLDEVQRFELRDLKGVDEVIRSLEANIILPLENDELAAELRLKPKRGVLLLGPPGTGKTSVGRALAHRLRGKFFLIDGTMIAGTERFYSNIHYVFESAKENAPSVLFIDDSDAIFESGEELGLYRYLLTMLDGLESESSARVCVMMTAMEVGHLPPALLRSGRVELWLEMRLPDEAARQAILQAHLAALPAYLGSIDYARVAAATSGFTGADLKRLAEDGKLLLAQDKAAGKSLVALTDYFLAAAQTVAGNKKSYAEAEARARQHRPVRGPHFDHVGAKQNANA
jgi:SpoVK/Ycf46/Vps4 family AAA+-type ATPase